MKTSFNAHNVVKRTMIIGGIMLATALTSQGVCLAETSVIYKIEEDWELVINEPDPVTISPQITFFTSPSSSESNYFQLQMNYAADELFSAGGFHVAAVDGDQIIDEARSVTRRVLASHNDHIRWTSAMAVINGTAFYAVKNGHGNEWGNFGGPEYLVKMPSHNATDLSQYHPQQSLDAVDIGFGANRVASLTLVEVRVYYIDGTSVTVPVNRSP